MNLDPKTLYWLAGLLEGEGSFLSRPPSKPGQPAIALVMTDEDVTSRVAGIFGVKYHIDRSKAGIHMIPYIVRLRGLRAVELMQQLFPLMSKRRQAQISRAIAGYVYEKGENHPLTKLNQEKVKEIRIRLAQGETTKSIADYFGVGQSTIRDIKRGLTWTYVNIDNN